MFFIPLLCVFILLMVLYVYNIHYKNKDYWKNRNVNQWNNVIKKFVFGNSSLAEVYKEVYDAYPSDPYVGTFRGSKPTLLLRDLENIQHVLADEFMNFHCRGFPMNSNDKLADNLLFMEDLKRWKVIRQKISPFFTTLRLKCLYEVMEKCASDFAKLMEVNLHMRSSPYHNLYTYTTASIAASVFGVDTGPVNAMESPFLDIPRKATAPSFRNNLIFAINTFPLIMKLLKIKFFGPYENFFVSAVKQLIKTRRQQPCTRYDLIDLFINLLDEGIIYDNSLNYNITVTEELLAAQAFFFFVSADSATNTMHFTLYELANNPEILKKVHEELDKVFNDCKEKVTFEDAEKLKYLDMVINETMRKFPVIGVMQRKCTKDTILPVGNIKVEKDVVVVIPVFAIHRDEKYYPDPERFDPNRFQNVNKRNRNNYCYMPFGEGHRICLGMRFSRIQLKIGLAWLLRKFTLRKQSERIETFEKSFFSIRAPKAYYELIRRTDNS